MVPESDLILRIPATSDVAKTSISSYGGEVSYVDRVSDTAIAFGVKLENPSALGFLPGQYVNIQVPGTDQTRSFSFSSGPGQDEVAFLARNTSHGVLTSYLRDRAKVGDKIEFNGPLGSLLPARDQAAGAVPGRRHRAGPVPVDAATRSNATAGRRIRCT